MKQTVNFNDFCDAWSNHDRNDSFSYAGKRALFDYIEQWEEDCGEEIELDVVALDCDYSEHASALSCVDDLGYADWIDDAERAELDEDECEERALGFLRDNTQVIEFEGGVIIQAF